MAQSFDLRSTAGGSALRDAAGIDTQLRNDPETDPLVLASLIAGSSLSAAARDYTSVELRWSVPSTLTTWTSLRVVSSSKGAPITPLMGDTVVTQASSSSNVRFIDTGLQPGRWRYYTLFLFVAAASPAWLPVARTDVLIPAQLNSVDLLWDGVPEYYRDKDGELGNPLHRLYELIGFEMDRINTFADTVKDLYDLDITPERLLPRLADSLGLGPEPDLGAERYRSLIKNFASICERKATLPGLELLGESITGCECDVNPYVSSGTSSVTVRSQRVNLCINPSFTGTVASPPGAWTFTGGTAAVTVATAIAGTTVTVVTATGTNDVVAQTSAFIPVTAGLKYGGSVYVQSQDAVNAHLEFKWYDVSNALLSTSVGSNVATVSGAFTNILEPGFTAPVNATQLKVSVVWTSVTSGHTVTADACLIEQGTVGGYFDGATNTGGSLDFQWEATANASRSHYIMNRSIVISRLLAYMADFMPSGSTWSVVTNSIS